MSLTKAQLLIYTQFWTEEMRNEDFYNDPFFFFSGFPIDPVHLAVKNVGFLFFFFSFWIFLALLQFLVIVSISFSTRLKKPFSDEKMAREHNLAVLNAENVFVCYIHSAERTYFLSHDNIFHINKTVSQWRPLSCTHVCLHLGT